MNPLQELADRYGVDTEHFTLTVAATLLLFAEQVPKMPNEDAQALLRSYYRIILAIMRGKPAAQRWLSKIAVHLMALLEQDDEQKDGHDG